MLSIVDWIWWSVGAVIGLGGIVLTFRALFADRSRGRRRCYKCWYEMTGIDTLRCPECGRAAKTERKLHRTHRHWRIAFIGALAVGIGGGGFFGQRVHQTGWVKATPAAVYIVGLPWIETQSMFDELDRRVEERQLARWETWLLIHRCVGQLERESTPQRLIRTAKTLGRIEWAGRKLQAEGPWTHPILVSEVDCDGAIDALVALFDHEDPKVQAAAVDAVRNFRESGVNAIPALIGLMWRDDDARPFFYTWLTLPREFSGDTPPDGGFCDKLDRCGTDRDSAAQVFREGLAHSNAATRAMAVSGLALFGRDDDLGRIASLADDPVETVRLAVIGASSKYPYDEVVAEIIRRGLYSEVHSVQAAAFEALGERAHLLAAQEFLDDLEAGLRDGRDVWIDHGAATYVHLGGDPELAIDVLLDDLRDDLPRWTGGRRPTRTELRLRQLARLGIESERVRDRVEQLVHDTGGEMRSKASVAYAMLGGDPDLATRIIVDEQSNSGFLLGLPPDATALLESGRVSVRVLIETLADDDPLRRAIASEMLGLVGVGAAAALPTLREFRGDEDADVAEHARLAIRRIEWEMEHQ